MMSCVGIPLSKQCQRYIMLRDMEQHIDSLCTFPALPPAPVTAQSLGMCHTDGRVLVSEYFLGWSDVPNTGDDI